MTFKIRTAPPTTLFSQTTPATKSTVQRCVRGLHSTDYVSYLYKHFTLAGLSASNTLPFCPLTFDQRSSLPFVATNRTLDTATPCSPTRLTLQSRNQLDPFPHTARHIRPGLSVVPIHDPLSHRPACTHILRHTDVVLHRRPFTGT